MENNDDEQKFIIKVFKSFGSTFKDEEIYASESVDGDLFNILIPKHSEEFLIYLLTAFNIRVSPISDRVFNTLFSRKFYALSKLLFPKTYVDNNRNAYLRMACSKGDVEMTKLLLNNVDPTDFYESPFLEPCVKGHTEIVKLLLEDGRVDPNAGFRTSPFEMAALGGNIDVMKLLLEDDRVEITEHVFHRAKSAAFKYGELAMCNFLMTTDELEKFKVKS